VEQKGFDFAGWEAPRPARPARLTVSQLTERIQGVLEVDFSDVWVEGEISNLKIASSGHWYFSLKDEYAQIRGVAWKTAARLIRFLPKDGMAVLARGSIRVYPPRGEYQISVEVLEPLGKGSLQQAFEDLKARLEKEGLFEPKRKRSLPMLPRRIGIVTSPTGAAIQDFLRVLAGRHRGLEVLIYPARVQGIEAAAEIAEGVRALNRVTGLDVLIVARGGGSLEDLWPFNEEAVARALAASSIPTVSAVGHETDFTIADFVADLRAATPSAAAERVVQAKDELIARIAALDKHLVSAFDFRMTQIRVRIASLTSHRVFEAERGRIRTYVQWIDDLVRRGEKGLLHQAERRKERTQRASEYIQRFSWSKALSLRREAVSRETDHLTRAFSSRLKSSRATLGRMAGMLEGLSPLSVLSRGYALVWDPGRGRFVREQGEVERGDRLQVRLRKGRLGVAVESKEPS